MAREMCLDTQDEAGEAGFLLKLKNQGWEVRRGMIVKTNEVNRTLDANKQAMFAWSLKEACKNVFHDDFEYFDVARWLVSEHRKHGKSKLPDVFQKVCVAESKVCAGMSLDDEEWSHARAHLKSMRKKRKGKEVQGSDGNAKATCGGQPPSQALPADDKSGARTTQCGA